MRIRASDLGSAGSALTARLSSPQFHAESPYYVCRNCLRSGYGRLGAKSRSRLPGRQNLTARYTTKVTSKDGASETIANNDFDTPRAPSKVSHTDEIFHVRDALPGSPFMTAIRWKNPRLALEHFLTEARNPSFVKAITGPIWTEFFRLLHPKRWGMPVHRVHRFTNVRQMKQIGYDSDTTDYTYFDNVRAVVAIRQEHAMPMELTDYRILLCYAASKGNRRAVENLWDEMQEHGIAPDTEAYNHFLAGKTYCEEMLAWRSVGRPRTVSVPNHNAALQSTEIFTKMSQDGMAADTCTIARLIAAMGRAGQLEKIKGLLLSAWNINVDALQGGKTELGSVTKYSATSSMAPNNQLLVQLAIAFGMNREIATGLAVIDYISHQYSIPIHRGVWFQLLQYTYLEARNSGPSDSASPMSGRIGYTSLRKIFEIMTCHPYNIKATIEMYFLLIKSLIYRRETKNAVSYLRQACHMFHSSVRKSGSLEGPPLRIEELNQKRDQQLLRRSARLLLSHDYRPIWLRQALPKFVWEFRYFMPRRIKYKISTGLVEIRAVHEKKRRHYPVQNTLATRPKEDQTAELGRIAKE